MIRFAFGYQVAGDESTAEIVRDYRRSVAEVYFSWPGTPSARAISSRRRGISDRAARKIMEEELRAIRKMGVKLDLLLNANCYGAGSVSRRLEYAIRQIIDRLRARAGGVDIVTAASPMAARTVKKYYPDIEVRASVNMRLGTIPALVYSREFFDSYYVQRDVQRSLPHFRRLKRWADANGKGLCLLANSGCLRYCPSQTFHDNLVAHDGEIAGTRNIADWNPHLCWSLYRDRKNWPAILQATWIRPEDLHRYGGLVRVVKLATRVHPHPRLVLHAYAQGQYRGNLLDLLEPGFGPAFAPYVLDNTRIPDGFFKRVSSCGTACATCRYCSRILAQALVRCA